MGLFILGHIIGDFFTQTDTISEKKKQSLSYMILHCILYSMGMFIVSMLATGGFLKSIAIMIILGLAHFIIDSIKVKLDLWRPKYAVHFFFLDQILHIGLVGVIAYSFKIVEGGVSGYFLPNSYGGVKVETIVIILIAVLVCLKPAAVLISLVFESIPQTIQEADNETVELGENLEEVRIGYWIGMMEREIILILGLLGQYAAIGFVLAAKSIARYKQLEKKSFAEKYLIGTLLSALIALVCVAFCTIFILN